MGRAVRPLVVLSFWIDLGKVARSDFEASNALHSAVLRDVIGADVDGGLVINSVFLVLCKTKFAAGAVHKHEPADASAGAGVGTTCV